MSERPKGQNPWTHRMCDRCWDAMRRAERGEPIRLWRDTLRPCCYCGEPTDSGIYVRAQPTTVKCQGLGPEHE